MRASVFLGVLLTLLSSAESWALSCSTTTTMPSSQCDDGNPCTTDICFTTTCESFSIGCTSDTCNSRVCTGVGYQPTCMVTPTNNSGTCNDGSAGTYGDTCSNGTCSGTACATCASGNYVATACGTGNTVCAACAANCTACTSAGATCTACTSGHYLSAGTCVSCSLCPTGKYASTACVSASDTVCTTCSTCAPGSYETIGCGGAQDRVCTPCPAHCNACSTSTCSTCATGYADCVGADPGCETDTTSSPAHCGSCSNACTAPANGTATCAASTCGFTCNTGFKKCGNACIANATCCTSADCAAADGCHDPGNCPSPGGVCSSPSKADGAPCDDGNACTNPDTCSAGVCTGGAPVTCATVDCKQLNCVPAAGCVATNKADGASCGNDGCYTAAASCAGGVCPGTATKTCTLQDDCKVGACDAVSGACTSYNRDNGTLCNLTDKCIIDTMCMAGACGGQAKVCPTSGECRVPSCDSASGNCKEDIAPAGTSCVPTDSCAITGSCDESGKCVGSGQPDGTPCVLTGCDDTSACYDGVCVCGIRDLGASASVDGGGDAGTASTDSGCEIGSRAIPMPAIFFVLFFAAMLYRRRRAHSS